MTTDVSGDYGGGGGVCIQKMSLNCPTVVVVVLVIVCAGRPTDRQLRNNNGYVGRCHR